jgi:hypothetical protein
MRLALLVAWGLVAAPICGAATLSQDFSSDPAADGWKIFGDADLFQWDSINQNLQVTWDSSQTNSYFYHPLPAVLAKDDDFGIAFDLQLADIACGVDTNKPSTFEFAISFLNFADATRTNFFRGSGINAVLGSHSTVEFAYFPESNDGSIAATVSPIMISTNNGFSFKDTFPLELTVSDLFHVDMSYTSSNTTLSTIMTRNGQPFGPVKDNKLGASFSDFRLDIVAVSSYSDGGQTPPQYSGSLLAHGTIDNFVVTLPPPPINNITGFFSNAVWQVQFTSRSNWLYTLESAADLQSWNAASPATPGLNGTLTLTDTNTSTKLFYRVRANRP